MLMKLKITTPKGHAKVTAGRYDVKKLLLFRTGATIKAEYVSPDNDYFVWDIDVPAAKYPVVSRNVALFSAGTYHMLKQIASSRLVKKRMEPGQEEELDRMLKETQIEIVKRDAIETGAGQ